MNRLLLNKMYFLLVLILVSCMQSESERSNYNKTEIVSTNKQTFPIENGCVVNIEQCNDDRDFIIRVVDTSTNYLYAVNGCGDCYVNTSDTVSFLVKRNFSNAEESCFTIEAGITASTYGAKHLFILWRDNNWKAWNLYRVPFENYFIEEKNGTSYISKVGKNGLKESFSFSEGLLISLKNSSTGL